ncbi:hypothetical protein HY383_02435 [Candidatus Daviesbacteria bacterium]|nr:hypothetical protein [Candidatus Daviesbacteria bacterium]
MNGEIGIFLDPYASKEVVRFVKDFTSQHTGRVVSEARQLPQLDDCKLILIGGGDGTANKVVSHLYNSGAEYHIGLLPSGTNHIFYNNLLQIARQTPEQFVKPRQEGTLRPSYFHPGKFGEHLFLVDCGTGTLEIAIGNLNKRYRWVPGAIRSKLIPVLSYLNTLKPSDDVTLNIFSTSPYLGVVKAFPNQKVDNSRSLTHAWIEGRLKAVRLNKLLITLACWSRGIVPPQSILKTEQVNTDCDAMQGQSLWVDGDTIEIRQDAGMQVKVRRERRVFEIVAIDLSLPKGQQIQPNSNKPYPNGFRQHTR